MIEFYTSPTPNGHKISCALENMQIPYKTITINLREHEQFTKEFSVLNPNHKIPAILDTSNNLKLAESGAILIYLAEKSGQLYPENNKYEILQWLMFQMAHIGPMMGQANVFFRYWPGDPIQPAIDRYQNEGRRLFEVLETRLKDNEYLADDFSIADIANWCWVRTHRWSGIKTDGLDGLQRWMKMMEERPACKRGVAIPVDILELMKKQKSEKDLKKTGSTIIQK